MKQGLIELPKLTMKNREKFHNIFKFSHMNLTQNFLEINKIFSPNLKRDSTHLLEINPTIGFDF